jgi:hypothetical protein
VNLTKRGFAALTISIIGYTLVTAIAAHAQTPPTYVAAHQKAGRQVPDPQDFNAIVGYADQCVTGVPCWTYTKGSRTADGSLPERWYLHVNGRRVKDSMFNLYVMNPSRVGWRKHVAAACPARCFIDGIGPSSLNRDRPRIRWTVAEWMRATAGLVKSVVATGKHVLPNSIGNTVAQGKGIVAAAGRGSTEGFTASDAKAVLGLGRIWVQEKGACLAKWHAFLRYRSRNDHFACYLNGDLPWDRSWMP